MIKVQQQPWRPPSYAFWCHSRVFKPRVGPVLLWRAAHRGSRTSRVPSDMLSCVPVRAWIIRSDISTPNSLCTPVNCCMMSSGDCQLVKSLVKLTRFLVVVDHNLIFDLNWMRCDKLMPDRSAQINKCYMETLFLQLDALFEILRLLIWTLVS